MTVRVMIYVQHLLGTGHYVRAAALADSLLHRNAAVTFVTGGMPLPGRAPVGATLVQLPPVRVNGTDFSNPVSEDGTVLDMRLEMARKDALLRAYWKALPDVLVTELFPFGRRRMKFELLPLLQAANALKPRPAVVSSIRDILQAPSKPGRAEEQMKIFADLYDGALVHGEAGLTPLTESYPAVAPYSHRLEYTGYVADQSVAPATGTDGTSEIVVAAGGGAVGTPLLRAAFAARAGGSAAGHTWRFLIGPNFPARTADALKQHASTLSGAPVIVEGNRSDYRGLLARAACSVSQAGYNTMMDVLATGVRAVVVPFADDGETEQTTRARLFARRGIVHHVDAANLSAQTISAGIASALASPRPQTGIRLDGADRGADFLLALAREHRDD